MNGPNVTLSPKPRTCYCGFLSLVVPLAAFVFGVPATYLVSRQVLGDDFFSGAVMVYTFVVLGVAGPIGAALTIAAVRRKEEWPLLAISSLLLNAVFVLLGLFGISFLL